MTYFYEYQIIQNSPRTTILYADSIWIPDRSEEDFCFGSPSCWDDTILERIGQGVYYAYQVDFYYVPITKCNRITDYKQIWGLRHIPKGIFETTFSHSAGKVYCGVSVIDNTDAFRQCSAPIVFFTKSESLHKLEAFQEALETACKLDFSEKDCITLEKILDGMADIIFLRHWVDNGRTALCVIGDTSLFTSEDLCIWEGAVSQIHPMYFV